MLGWAKIGAMCAGLVFLLWRAFKEAAEARPQS